MGHHAPTPWAGWDEDDDDDEAQVNDAQLLLSPPEIPREENVIREEEMDTSGEPMPGPSSEKNNIHGEQKEENTVDDHPEAIPSSSNAGNDETPASVDSSMPTGRFGKKRKNKDRSSNLLSTKRIAKKSAKVLESEDVATAADIGAENEEKVEEKDKKTTDPDFYIPPRTRRSTSKNYNMKALMQAEIDKGYQYQTTRQRRQRTMSSGTETTVVAPRTNNKKIPRRRGRPSKVSASPPTLSLQSVPLKDIDLYMRFIPDMDSELPSDTDRTVIQKFDSHPHIMLSSGGFRLFISSLTDARVVELYRIVQGGHKFPIKDDFFNVLQALRHVYNSTSSNYRRRWEWKARRLAGFNASAIENEVPIFENVKCKKEVVDEDFLKEEERKIIDSLKDKPSMPFTEFPIESEEMEHWQRMKIMQHNFKSVHISCCSHSTPFESFKDVQAHFLAAHYTAMFYGCHLCGELFNTKEQLLRHPNCERFANYVLEEAMNGNQIEMKRGCLVMVCNDCGLWLPIRVSVGRSSKTWAFFLVLMNNHSCKGLIPVVIYLAHDMSAEVKEYKLKFLPSFIKSFPLSCKKCDIDEFVTPEECELHYASNHADPSRYCTKCGVQFGTDVYFKNHMYSKRHLADLSLVADYFRHTCRFYPPPHVDDIVRVGSISMMKSSGGLTQRLIKPVITHDYIDADAKLPRKKLMNNIKTLHISWNRDTSDDNEEGCDKNQNRSDLGHEFQDYSDLDETTEEAKIKGNLSKLFQNMCDTNEINSHTKLINANEIAEKLKIKNGVSDNMIKRLSIKCKGNTFVDKLVSSMSRTILLPITSCTEPISNYHLDRRYVYCSQCYSILCGSLIEQHACGPSKMTTLYNPSCPSNSELECMECHEGLCSIRSFRAHMATCHLKMTEYLAPSQEKTAKLSDLVDQPFDNRSPFAKATDIRFGMENGRLPSLPPNERPRTYVPPHVPRPTSSTVTVLNRNPTKAQQPPRANIPAQRPRILLSHVNQKSLTAATNNSMNTSQYQQSNNVEIQYCPPYHAKYSMGITTLCCNFCPFTGNEQNEIQVHLRRFHTVICRGCGCAFADEVSLSTHRKKNCNQFLRNAQAGFVHASCNVCQSRYPLPTLYNHMFNDHFLNVKYSSQTGQMYPVPAHVVYQGNTQHASLPTQAYPVIPNDSNVSSHAEQLQKGVYARVMQNTKGSKMLLPVTTTRIPSVYSSTETAFINKNQEEYVCYMCGLEHESNAHLRRHYASHPEKWMYCPFCRNCERSFKINNHQEFSQHLLNVHAIAFNSGLFKCIFCTKLMRGGMEAHLLYECVRSKICAIGNCSFKYQIILEGGENFHVLQHRMEKHLDVFKRFKCSECSMTFCSVWTYRQHVCNTANLAHICNCDKRSLFPNRESVHDHYNLFHVTIHSGYKCDFCGLKYTDQNELDAHANNHYKIVGNPNKRAMIIVDTSLRTNAVVDQESNYDENDDDDCVEIIMEKNNIIMREEIEDVISAVNNTVLDIIKTVCMRDNGEDVDYPPPSSSHHNTGMPSSESCLNASIRVEQNDEDVVGGHGLPGYIDEEDDDIEYLSQSAMKTDKPVLTEIEGTAADDELQIVAEVEHSNATTVAASFASMRQKSFKCTRCSALFYTQRSMNEHLKTSHNHDAGNNICQEVFGVPTDKPSYICRNCCIAFEDRLTAQQHKKAHGVDGSLSCSRCSGVSYSTILANQHELAHRDPNRLYYGCTQCGILFKTDARLFHHLLTVHSVPIYYFCKICSFGSVDIDWLAHHLSPDSFCVAQLRTKGWIRTAGLGLCPAASLHYQPKNVQLHIQQLSTHNSIIPSECTHRSFLAPTYNLLTCPECYCTMSYAAYSSLEALKNNGIEPKLSYPCDPSEQFPFVFPVPPQARYRTNVIVGNRVGEKIVPPASNPVTTSLSNNVSTGQQHGRLLASLARPMSSYQSLSPSSIGGRIMRPLETSMIQRGGMNGRVGYMETLTRHQNGASRGGMNGSIERSSGMTASRTWRPQIIQTPPQPLSIPIRNHVEERNEDTSLNGLAGISHKQTKKNGAEMMTLDEEIRINKATNQEGAELENGERSEKKAEDKMCEVCHAKKDTASVVRLHSLHRNGHKFFCFRCAYSFTNELDCVKHVYEEHVKEWEIRWDNAKGPFRPLKFSLHCPFSNCTEVFTTTTTLHRHVESAHSDESPFKSSFCSLTFLNEEAKKKHDEEHETYQEINGVEGHCCGLCGTLNTWSVQLPGHTYVAQHIAVHGMRVAGMCRECLHCFKSDQDLVRHYTTVHCNSHTEEGVYCKTCKDIVLRHNILEHVKDKHQVFGMKTIRERCIEVECGSSFMKLIGFSSEECHRFDQQLPDKV